MVYLFNMYKQKELEIMFYYAIKNITRVNPRVSPYAIITVICELLKYTNTKKNILMDAYKKIMHPKNKVSQKIVVAILFEVGYTKSDIGHITGLTFMHVNRLLKDINIKSMYIPNDLLEEEEVQVVTEFMIVTRVLKDMFNIANRYVEKNL